MSSKEARHCPKCGTAMSYRLGEFDCPSCGHSESAAPQKEERSWGSSSDSVNRAKLIAPPPPPTGSGSGYNLGGTPPDGMYGGEGPPARAGGGSLHTEKIIFMAIQGVSALVLVILGFTLGAMSPDDGGLGAGLAVGALIGALINVVLYGMVLFSDAVWLKWTCLGCQTLGLIGAFVQMFTPNAADFDAGTAGVITFFKFAQFAYVLWFASIIYRDIMQQQEY